MKEAASTKYVIVHGHFYQPPRENPWTERIERQPGTEPYHDWNDKIANECYLPNAFSRRLDEWGRITKLLNNYESMSFNFGPTLISYLEDHFPEVYERILEADRASLARLGHGNAIAQCYNHIIMPLASRRDMETQVRWGVRDFERRFGRFPEGIWLPETAVNEEVLSLLVDHGFRFIILGPHQALRTRPLEGAANQSGIAADPPRTAAQAKSQGAEHDSLWKDVSKGNIPTGMPYRCFAMGPKGKRDPQRFIDIFFYDAPLSTDVSFNHLLRNGDRFAEAIEFGFERGGGDLVVVATDGEIYGHHEPFADMAFSYLVDSAAPRHGFVLTNFATYLEKHPPSHEVELKPGPNGEGTSWSCFHGVARWKEDCGCTTGGKPSWNQRWRSPLRAALTSLARALDSAYEEDTRGILADPWQARDDYIELVSERNPDSSREFVLAHATRELSAEEISRVLSLLESQRNAQLMFTSCGWFFADISGLESVQVLRYAARAVELAGPHRRTDLEKRLIEDLRGAVSNIAGKGTGADIYLSAKKSSSIGARCIVALYAIGTHLSAKEEPARIYGHPIRISSSTIRRLDGATLRLGIIELSSRFTLETRRFEYLLFVEKDAGFSCYVRELEEGYAPSQSLERFEELARSGSNELLQAAASDYFGSPITARDFLPEDRERIIRQFAHRRLEIVEERFGEIYSESRALLKLLSEAGMQAPPSLSVPAQAHLTRRLVEETERWERSLDPAGLEGIRRIVSEASAHGVKIDTSCASQSFTELVLEKLKILASDLRAESATALEQFVNMSDQLGIEINFRDIQNEVYDILVTRIDPLLEGASGREKLSAAAKEAIAAFLALARRFNFNTESWERKLSSF